MYVCLMDRQGNKLVHCNIKDNDFEYFLKLIKPYSYGPSTASTIDSIASKGARRRLRMGSEAFLQRASF